VERVVAVAVETVPLLLVGTFDGGRLAVPLATVARLEEFPRSALERAGRGRVVQYRGEILPLIEVGRELRRMAGKSPPTRRRGKARPAPTGTVSVVVCVEGGVRVGLLVRKILDIVNEELTTIGAATRPGIRSTAVVQGRVTELLDLSALLRAAELSAGEPPRVSA